MGMLIRLIRGDDMSKSKLEDKQLNEVLSYLKAWPFSLIQKALKLWRVEDATTRFKEGWKPFVGDVKDIPSGFDWRSIGEKKIQIRPSFDHEAARMKHEEEMKAGVVRNIPTSTKKTDLSAKKVKGLKCPDCGDTEMFKEYICPGCTEGKKGFKVRLLCGGCEYTILL